MTPALFGFLLGVLAGVLGGRRWRRAELESRLAAADREVEAARAALGRVERDRRRLRRRLGDEADRW